MTTDETLTADLDWLRDHRHLTGPTLYRYASVYKQFALWLGHCPLGHVTADMIEAFIQRPRSGGRMPKPATSSTEATVLRSLFNRLTLKGSVPANPALLVRGPKVRRRNPKPLEDHVWRVLWGSCEDDAERLFLGLGCFLGLRRAEIASLEVGNVNARTQQLVGFVRKGGGDDVLPYSDVCDVLSEHLAFDGAAEFPAFLARIVAEREGRRFVLPWGDLVAVHGPTTYHARPVGMLDPNQLNRRMAAMCERAGLVHLTPHQLRHTFVTNLLRCGVPLEIVQRLANHSDPAVTMGYAKVSASALKNWQRTQVNRHG